MTVPLPVYTPLLLETQGGIFGAIRRKINVLPDMLTVFGDRIYPGRAPPSTSFPYVVMNHVSCVLDDYMALAEPQMNPLPIDSWKETIQVSTYADNYEAARQLGRAIHVRISRHTLCVDSYPAFVYPMLRMILLDPNKNERGADVWHADYRYYFWTLEWIFRDAFEIPPAQTRVGDTTFNLDALLPPYG